MVELNCQQCSQTFSDDFGLVTCPHCGHVQMLSDDSEVFQIEVPDFPDDHLLGVSPEEIQSSESYDEPALTQDLSEVEAFANSEISSTPHGPYVYDLLIEGIDNKEVRFLIRDALAEKRLALDADGLMNQVQMGRLQIAKLNPVKISLLVQRIKSLPIQISWVQHAVVEL